MKFAVSLIVILGMMHHPILAGSSDFSQTWNDENAQLRFAMTQPVLLDNTAISTSNSDAMTVQKSPKLGVLMSALIPGTGQMYVKSWLKGVLFFGAEVALWMGYHHYRNEGDRLKTEFRAFANTHWIEARYWTAMAVEKGIPGASIENYQDFHYQDYLEGEDGLREYERIHHSHSLHVVKDQQYYEMIGKYHQFEYGWDDFDPDLYKVSPNRAYYEDLEYRTDSQYRNAGTCAMIVLGNHLISALDVAWNVHRHKTSMRIQPKMGIIDTPNERIPTTGFAVQW